MFVLAASGAALLSGCSNGGDSDGSGATSQTSSIVYDASGRLSRVDYGDGRTVLYEYDAAGNVTRRITRN